MEVAAPDALSPQLIAALERKYFWWEPVGSEPRSPWRILAQAMDLASFDDMRRLENELGPEILVRAMLSAQPGWFSARSWEYWRGRLAFVTRRAIPEEPPRRSFDAAPV